MIGKTINEDFDLLYSEDNFKSKSRRETKEFKDMSEIYGSTISKMPKIGDVLEGQYQGDQGGYHMFSVPGLKDGVRVSIKQSESKYLGSIEEGDSLEILVKHIDHGYFYIEGSISELYESMAHDTLKSLDDKESVFVKVLSLNPAGYDVEIMHGSVQLPAFMPNTLAGINKLYDPESIIGDVFEVMIESYSERESTYIVSRRKYLMSLIPEAVKELSYEDSYKGYVTGTTPFGVFVEFNECLTGMIHKANINPEWSERISEIKPGFEIEFYVKEIIKERNRYKLILTQILRETLWDSIEENDVIEGTIKAIKQFGALVSLDDETVGLIHISKMNKNTKSLVVGDKLDVAVIDVDRMGRKIFLEPYVSE